MSLLWDSSHAPAGPVQGEPIEGSSKRLGVYDTARLEAVPLLEGHGSRYGFHW
jgi:hypothetical protein